jgi:hypothetical protein
MKIERTSRRRAIGLLSFSMAAGAAAPMIASRANAAALPPWYDAANQTGYKTDVPDFYQHEFLAGNPGGVAGWEQFGGWCRPTALTDALYTFAANGYPNLLPAGFNNAAGWLNASGTAIAALQNVQGQGINAFLGAAGYGFAKGPGVGKGLVFNQYIVSSTGALTYISSTGARRAYPGTAFDLIQNKLLVNQDVMIRLADTNAHPNINDPTPKFPLHWWSGPNVFGGNYHYVDAAGFDAVNNQLFFADPDSNKGSGDGNAGWTGKNNDPTAKVIRYAPGDPVPVPARGAALTDPPVNAGNFYSSVSIANGFKFSSLDRYNGCRITAIESIAPVIAAKRGGNTGPITFGPAAGGTANTLDIESELEDNVDKVLVYPAGTDPMSGGPDSLSGNGASFSEHDLAASALDPFGDTHENGGFEFDETGALGLEPDVVDTLALDTSADFSGFDVFLHDAVTDTWAVEAIGAPEDISVDTQVPEPAASMFALIIATATMMRRHRRRHV